MVISSEADILIDPPPKNASRSKWFNLISFLFLDLIQILIITSIQINDDDSSIIGFDVGFILPRPEIALLVLIIIYIFRSYYGNYAFIQSFKKPEMIQLYPILPEIHKYDLIIEPYSAEDISNWVISLAKEMKIGKIHKIFLVKTAIPNAYTIQISKFPFLWIRNQNYVVLNSNITKILNKTEVQAVIAHELGHIKNNDSVIRKILSGPHIFLQVAYILLYIRILTGILNSLLINFNPITAAIRTLFLFIVMILATLASDWTINFLRKSNQMAELQADLKPIDLVGYKPTINMLIKLGQRTEVLDTLKRETVWLEKRDVYRENLRIGLIFEILEKFSENEIDDFKVRINAPKVYLTKLLDILRDYYFLDLKDLPGLQERVEKAAKDLFDQRKDHLERIDPKRKKIIDWREFDLDKDKSLKIEEIKKFVKHLGNNPQMLFQNENLDSKQPLERNHPSFRTRILYVSQQQIDLN